MAVKNTTTKTPATKPVTKPSAPVKTLAKTPPKALAPVSVNAEEDAGVGQEDITAQDMAIPQIVILQSGSPQVKKSDPAFIKGSEEGAICDPLAERIFPGEEGVLVVPVSYRRSYIEWKDREDGGGGFVKDHGSDASILDKCKEGAKKRPTLPNGNTISTVAEYFIFLVGEDGSYAPYVLRMTSTQLKKARRWNTMMNQLRVPKSDGSGTFNPAMFFKSYRLTTVPESNDYGSWYGWKIAPEEDVLALEGGEALYMAARDFRSNVVAGKVATHAPTEETHAGAGVVDNDSPM